MLLPPNPPPVSAATAGNDFEWRANVAPWRWLILGALGIAPTACGGRTEAPPAEPLVAGLEGRGGPASGGTGSVVTPPRPTGSGATPSAAGPGQVAPPSPPLFPAQMPLTPTWPATMASGCESSSPLGGGWLRCDNGMLHRATAGACESSVPRPEPVNIPPEYADAGAGQYLGCREDSDCNVGPYGYCDWSNGEALGSFCNYGCVVDADCGSGQVCVCGEPVGQCAQARCTIDADCGAGQLCGDFVANPGCGGMEFACQTGSDLCAASSDCPESYSCTLDTYEKPTRRVCSAPQCVIGRPFLIDGRERLAPPVAHADWCPPTEEAKGQREGVDSALRAEVIRGWTEQGLMEHASVAAFARFSLQLLSLGAPPDLVTRAAEAMQDETRHAQACFGLARLYSGTDVGPGPLAIDGALEESDLRSVVLSTIAEGCIGETVAALEAAEALAHCEEAPARAVLERIAIEESRHAELAWQFVAWALSSGPESLKEQVRGAFEPALASPGRDRVRPSSFDRELLRHGLMSAELRRGLRERALREVIAPCARALLESSGSREAGPHFSRRQIFSSATAT